MFALVNELLRNLHLQKQCGRIDLVRGARLLMLPGLLQVGTVAGTVERHLALFAATLRADAPMHRGTKPLLLANLADGAAQLRSPSQHYVIPATEFTTEAPSDGDTCLFLSKAARVRFSL